MPSICSSSGRIGVWPSSSTRSSSMKLAKRSPIFFASLPPTFPSAQASMISRTCSSAVSASITKGPHEDRSPGISAVSSQLPFTWPNRSSWTRMSVLKPSRASSRIVTRAIYLRHGGAPRRRLPDVGSGLMTGTGYGARQAQVCIIGAGSSGITVAQVLAGRGVDFDCFEAGSGIGGNWRYGNDNEMSSAYESLHINTSRQMMEYAAYPMPESLPDYPDHRQVARYFDDFVDHYGLRERITFRTEVTRIRPLPASTETGTRYEVTTRSRDGGAPETRTYRDVIVANGHHWDPRWPEPSFPGQDTFPG